MLRRVLQSAKQVCCLMCPPLVCLQNKKKKKKNFKDIVRLKKVLTDNDATRRKTDTKLQGLLSAYSEFENQLSKNEENRELSKRKIAGYKNEIQKLEKMMAELPDPKNTGPELAQISKDLEKLQAKVRQATESERAASKTMQDRDAAMNANRAALGKLENDRAKREDRFRASHPDVFRLTEWVRKSAHLFKGPVHGPLALEIQPASDRAATMLERLIPRNVLGAFLVTCGEDTDILRKKATEMQVRFWLHEWFFFFFFFFFFF